MSNERTNDSIIKNLQYMFNYFWCVHRIASFLLVLLFIASLFAESVPPLAQTLINWSPVIIFGGFILTSVLNRALNKFKYLEPGSVVLVKPGEDESETE